MEENRFAPRSAPAPEAAADEPASPVNQGDSYLSPQRVEHDPPPCEKVTVPPPLTDFDPVPLRYRRDGLTPQRQRDYVEALADTGVARAAAARIGVSEQAVARVRRRADARAFDLACEAAQRIGARRLRSIAWERAIEGTVKRHFYHGELKGEEVVYDNRLLIYLLGRTAHLAEPPPETRAVLDDWDGWMEAIERGLPAPPAAAAESDADADADLEEEEEEDFGFDGNEVWKDEDGIWWTAFPPSEDFYGREEGVPGEADYERTLSAAELEAVEAGEDEEYEEKLALQCARRDAFFGFAGERSTEGKEARIEARARERAAADAAALAAWAAEREQAVDGPGIFSSRQAETHETSTAAPASSSAVAGSGCGP